MTEPNVYKAIENACEHLPDGFKIEIWLERGSGTISLTDPNGDEHDFPSNHENMEDEINDAVEYAKELDRVPEELVLAPPAVCDALDDLISIVELMPEAQDPSTDLWASLFTARESLRSATLSETTEQDNGV